jgi:hypothetical protein
LCAWPVKCWTAAGGGCSQTGLAGEVLDRSRRRVQPDLHGHRGRKNDLLDSARRTLHTGADLLTDRQRQRLTALFDT